MNDQEKAEQEAWDNQVPYAAPDGGWWARCRACGVAYELWFDHVKFDPVLSYCGRTPECMP
jgi:hypothetical protein